MNRPNPRRLGRLRRAALRAGVRILSRASRRGRLGRWRDRAEAVLDGRRRAHTIRYHPVTLGRLLDLCSVLGVSIDDVLRDPASTLSGVDIGLETAARAVAVVVVDPPDIGSWEPWEAGGYATAAVGHFFAVAWSRNLRERLKRI